MAASCLQRLLAVAALTTMLLLADGTCPTANGRRVAPRVAAPFRRPLALRGGGWLDSSESGSAASEAATVAAASGDSSSVDEAGAAAGSKFTLSSNGLLDPLQHNLTDDVLDLFLRPPARPTTRDGRPLCGVGLLLSSTKPHCVEYIHPGSPADLCAKILLGDQVVAMDGKGLAELSWEQIRDMGLGFEGTALALEVLPAEAVRGRAEHASFTVELQRTADFLPRWARPADDDPGGEGPAAQAWKNKTRAMVRFGCVCVCVCVCVQRVRERGKWTDS